MFTLGSSTKNRRIKVIEPFHASETSGTKWVNKGKVWPRKDKVRIRYSFLGYFFFIQEFPCIAFYYDFPTHQIDVFSKDGISLKNYRII